ncbi:MAG: DUF4062 domain-containing protein [Planctomycetes bacterium]|nr:DUF4062 domain-containing protein [Planctomycetota bacterium]
MRKTFLSSTYDDLVEHRKAAAEALERLGQQADRMEVFGARPEKPTDACLSEIDKCDLFVGIYAHRYGFVPEGSVVSITEAEFDYSKRHNKPVFCFLVDEDHPWPPKMIEDEPGKSKLRILKEKIGSGLVRDSFTTSEDLAYKVAAALGRYLSTTGNTRTTSTPNPYVSSMQSAGDLVDLLEKSLHELEDLTRTDYNQIFLITTESYSRNLLAVADALPEHKQRYRIATFAGLLGSVAASGKTLNAPDVRERPGYFQAVLQTKSELIVPIGNSNAVLGVLNSESEQVGHYSSEIVQSVEALANALSQLLPSFGWTPGTTKEKAPWIQRTARHKDA